MTVEEFIISLNSLPMEWKDFEVRILLEKHDKIRRHLKDGKLSLSSDREYKYVEFEREGLSAERDKAFYLLLKEKEDNPL